MLGDIALENNVIISVDMKDYENGIDRAYSSVIECKRYTQPIIYGEKECKSRYGEDATFTERRHNLIALFPMSFDDLKDYKGLMYSFLPTQIQMTAPIVLHVPFKLDRSRQFVDPQNENRWFTYTIDNLESFLKKIYVHLASEIKQDIVTYIPNRHNFFFKKTNEKIQCLLRNGLKGDEICKQKVFYVTDSTYESADNIVAFAETEELENPVEVFAFLGENTKLFIPNYSINMQWYNVRVISNVPALQIRQASDKLNDAGESMNDIEYLKLLRSVRVSLKNAFGNRMYNNYIRIINQAGTDKNRFLNELLQNADDCRYPEGEIPTFDLRISGSGSNSVITVTYNELGFTKQNVRAITAI